MNNKLNAKVLKRNTKIIKENNLICPFCESKHIVKNGIKNNKQKYLCRDCNRTISYEKDNRIKRDIKQRELCLLLYSSNMTMRSIQNTINIFFNTNISIRLIEKWIKYASKLLNNNINNKDTKDEKDVKVKQKIEILEIDEVWSCYLDNNIKKTQNMDCC